MTSPFDRAHEASEFLRQQSLVRPTVGIILGSGLGHFATLLTQATAISYGQIPHFPISTVAGHAGQLHLGLASGVPVAIMEGRVHAYEGYTPSEIAFPTRVLSLLGCRTLVITNAAGAIDPALPTGSLALITDHINLTGINVAAGPNEPRFATTPGTAERFFDMSTAYSKRLRALAHMEADRLGIALHDGVYLAVLGPSFETPAEIRAFRTLGATLVGMSTVHEVILARHMGIEVLGISLVSNPAAGVSTEPVNHKDVLRIGEHAAAQLAALLQQLLPAFGSNNNPGSTHLRDALGASHA